MAIPLIFRMLEKRSLSYIDGPIPVPPEETFLADNVERICVCDTGFFFLVTCLFGS